jgi:signal transduction histidine kinase
MRRPKIIRLRRFLTLPLVITFCLLGVCMVALRLSAACNALENQAQLARWAAQASMEEQWGYYEQNLANGLGAEAAHILEDNLSSASLGRLEVMDGGAAFLIRDGSGQVIRSQITWGYGHVEGVDRGQRWHLRFDEGLDDEGQLALARWLTAHRTGWAYAIYPEDDADSGASPGTYARVTGQELPGYAVAVQKVEIVSPDGSAELMVETGVQGDNPITLELSYLQLRSVLLPSWSSVGDGYVNMERRLANFRAAQAVLDQALAGEVTGSVLGTREGDGITLRYTASRYQPLPCALRQNGISCLLLLLVLVLAGLLLARRLARTVTQPVEALCRSVETGEYGEDGAILELNTLSHAFQDAQKQLEQQLERERNFSRGAAHELKTPLSVLRAHAEALQEDIAPEKRSAYLSVVLEESDRMAQLVSRLLELSRLESGRPLEKERLELSALVRHSLAPLTLLLDQKGLSLTLDLEEVWLDGNRACLEEAVDNLLSNALRHGVSGGGIRVGLHAGDGWILLEVYNDGTPIPPEDLPHLWEPFYRGDKARSRASGGTGLGLAIVRAAVQAHGGTWGAENQEGGVLFWIGLPCPPLVPPVI